MFERGCIEQFGKTRKAGSIDKSKTVPRVVAEHALQFGFKLFFAISGDRKTIGIGQGRLDPSCRQIQGA